MKKFLRFERGKEPGQLVPVCTCGIAHLNTEITCEKCGLKYASTHTPEYALKMTLLALKSMEPDENGNRTFTFGPEFIEMLEKAVGEE